MLPLPWVVWWGRQRDTNVTLEGVVEDRKHGSCYKKEEQKKGGEERARGGGADNKPTTLSFIKLSCCCVDCFPAPAFTARACTKQATPNKHNQSQPTRPIPSSFPPFLSGGDYWLDLKDFLFPKTSTESISSPGRRFWLYQGPETPNPPSCCWETTPVICVLSECITDGDVRASERERETQRWERNLSWRAWKKEMEKKIYYMHIYSAPFFFHALSPYKHTLHCGARLTCFDTPSSLSLSFLFLSFSFWD